MGREIESRQGIGDSSFLHMHPTMGKNVINRPGVNIKNMLADVFDID
jgi:hypothetical protein